MKAERELYALLGELLEYPGAGLPEAARRCQNLASSLRATAAEALAPFLSFVDSAPLERLEELYTATFDLDPVCCPYAGHHLLGDDPKRALLMVKLQDRYRSAGFDAGRELPDHLSVVLRFLSIEEDPDLERDLLAPALRKMAASLDGQNPYGNVVRAALQAVNDEC